VDALAAELVITAGKSPLRIQGQFAASERPDEIVVEGLAGSPAITVESDAELTLRHLTITGGTVGIQALDSSRVTLERVYISETGNEGMSVTMAEQVDITSSIFNACGDAGLLVNSGTVDIAQSTFIDNTDLAIDLQGGNCQVGASLFYNNNGGPTMDQLSGAMAGLSLDFCMVLSQVGPNVVETNVVDGSDPGFPAASLVALSDPDNLLFDGASPWRGRLLEPIPAPAGTDSGMVNTDASFGRDFVYLARDLTDIQVGAHEFGAVATGANWVECIVTQYNNPTPGVVGLGRIDIEVFMSTGPLDGAVLYLVPQYGDILTNGRRIPIPLAPTVPGSENYSTASLLIDGTYVNLNGTDLPLDGTAELFLQNPGDPGFDNFPGLAGEAAYGTGYNDSLIEPAAQRGRFFIIDTLPPQIENFEFKRAHEYITFHTDTNAPGIPDGTGGFIVPAWSAAVDANLASSQGVIDGATSSNDPQVFFNERDNTLDFTLEVTFVDSGMLAEGPVAASGFSPAPVSQTRTGNAIFDLLVDQSSVAGSVWWQSAKDMPVLGTSQLTINYSGGGVNTPLTAEWVFTGLPVAITTDTLFWEAIAQFGARDLAGNTSGAEGGMNEYVFKPFHIWQLYDVEGTIEAGPGGRETTSPIINWGVRRFNGVTPRNSSNANPIAQYAVYRHPGSTNPFDVGWTIAGTDEWSDWIAPTRIDKFTRFRGNVRLGDIIQNTGMYMIVVRAADEAGNVVNTAYPPLGTLNAGTIPFGYAADVWLNGGPSISLDTRVTPIFWHNRVGLNQRAPDQGERVFGANPRIPLPAFDSCERVEGGFTITMDLPDTESTDAAFVGFELLEDGRLVASGMIDGAAGSSDITLIVPQDLLNPAGVPTAITLFDPQPTVGYLEFLNLSPNICGPVRDRLGDDGNPGIESAYRHRDVKYQLIVATGITDPVTLNPVYDQTPATVEFTVTVDRGLKDDQPIKSFTQE